MPDILNKKWHTVNYPFGEGTWIVAGDPDPHVGDFVCACYDEADRRFEDDLDEKEIEEIKSVKRKIANHIVEVHNKGLGISGDNLGIEIIKAVIIKCLKIGIMISRDENNYCFNILKRRSKKRVDNDRKNIG